MVSSLHRMDFDSLSTSERFTIASSSPLSEEERMEAEATLLREASAALSRWRQEKRYIPRLMLSAAVFIVLYLFLSVAVPDPIPVVDEILLSLLGAAGIWIIVSRMDARSSYMAGKLEAIEVSIAEAKAMASDDMRSIEDLYARFQSMGLLELAEAISSGSLPALAEAPEWLEDFSEALHMHLKASDRGIDRTIARIGGRGSERFLIHQVTTGALDMPDLALYLAPVAGPDKVPAAGVPDD